MSQRCVTLIGPMGSGKTDVGEQLADRLGYEFADTDQMVEERAGKKILNIFNDGGEAVFRELESEVIAELDGSKGTVISAGGGSILDPQNMHIFQSAGLIVYLKASPRELYYRVKNDKNRPLLVNAADPQKELDRILKEREPVYEKADIVVDTEDLSVEEVCDVLIDELAKRTIQD